MNHHPHMYQQAEEISGGRRRTMKIVMGIFTSIPMHSLIVFGHMQYPSKTHILSRFEPQMDRVPHELRWGVWTCHSSRNCRIWPQRSPSCDSRSSHKQAKSWVCRQGFRVRSNRRSTPTRFASSMLFASKSDATRATVTDVG